MNIYKIVVVSDTHGNTYALKKLITKHLNANLIIHLGDGENEFFQIKQQFKTLNMLMVKGNCDLDLNNKLPKIKILTINNFKILACHGHEFQVKQNLQNIQTTAKNSKANLTLFGHTHIKYNQNVEGITFFNPGSLSLPRTQKPSFGIITIENNKINAQNLNFQ